MHIAAPKETAEDARAGALHFWNRDVWGEYFMSKKYFEWRDKRMAIRTVLEGNSFYEIDEECMEQRMKERGTAGAVTENGGWTVMKQKQQGRGTAGEAMTAGGRMIGE